MCWKEVTISGLVLFHLEWHHTKMQQQFYKIPLSIFILHLHNTINPSLLCKMTWVLFKIFSSVTMSHLSIVRLPWKITRNLFHFHLQLYFISFFPARGAALRFLPHSVILSQVFPAFSSFDPIMEVVFTYLLPHFPVEHVSSGFCLTTQEWYRLLQSIKGDTYWQKRKGG